MPEIPGIRKEYSGVDYTQTQGVLVPHSGRSANKAVNYSEVAEAFTRRITVAVRFLSLAAASAAEPGLTLGSGTWTEWFLVDNASNVSENGIYQFSQGRPVRVPQYSKSSDIPPSSLIFVDRGTYANTFWLAADGAIAGANNAIASLPLVAFDRSITVDAASFLRLSDYQLSAVLNANYLQVANGALSLATAFLARIGKLETDLAALQNTRVFRGAAPPTTGLLNYDEFIETANNKIRYWYYRNGAWLSQNVLTASTSILALSASGSLGVMFSEPIDILSVFVEAFQITGVPAGAQGLLNHWTFSPKIARGSTNADFSPAISISLQNSTIAANQTLRANAVIDQVVTLQGSPGGTGGRGFAIDAVRNGSAPNLNQFCGSLHYRRIRP